MDFDLLSQSWQQHTPAFTSQSAASNLTQLLGRQGGSPIAQMRKNVWVEIGGTVVFGLLVLTVLFLVNAPRLSFLLLLLSPFYGAVGYCYFRIFQVLRQLGLTTENVAGHVAHQLQQLRQLVRLYYWSTMLTALLLLGWVSYIATQHILPHLPAAATGRLLTWGILTALVSYGLMHWISRYHLQTYYGQHLDRLESVLHELHDSPSAF